MGSDGSAAKTPLHMLFFPMMSPGHLIPMVDMARLFSQRGIRATIVTTPINATNIRPTVESAALSGHPLHLQIIPFPSPSVTGLSPGQENLSAVPTSGFNTFVMALFHFQSPLSSLIQDLRPDCIVSDSLFPWTADLGIPRLIFHGAGAFPLFVLSNIFSCFPIERDSFTMTGLPHQIHLYKDGLPELVDNLLMLKLLGEAEEKSYGVVINTYSEMEPTYVEHYKTRGGASKAWCVGPVSLCSRAESDRAVRGEAPAQYVKVISWLDRKQAGSVIYVCFGSLCHFSGGQLAEIALGLEKSGKSFVWVVRKEPEGDAVVEGEWMPEGLEDRVKDRGMVIRGWAPQTLILGHEAIGWFVTHCGWNSLQEGVCAGLPMVTWPLFHEQFINQELLVGVMGIGVRMWEGFRRNRLEEEKVLVRADEIAGVVGRVMDGGEEVEEMIKKARDYGEKARKAVEEGGSTYNDITDLIEDLEVVRHRKVE